MKQATALDILKQGHSVFLTGQAGAGKTYVLTQFIKYLREQGVAVAVTATTGIAATQMSGVTIHAWSGIGIKNSFEAKDFKRLAENKEFVSRLKIFKVLIVDEISMLHAKQLDLVDEVLRHFHKNDLPFGGVQVVFSGDFFQLPPIGEKGETTKDKFAFMSKAWVKLASTLEMGVPKLKVCYLSEQHRQVDDGKAGIGLNDILNQIRNQSISQDAIAALLTTRTQSITEKRTRLYTHNMSVDKINESELNALTGKSYRFVAETTGKDTLIETLKKTVRAPEILNLKVGAKVMFVKNNPIDEVYNGTMGTVVGFIGEDDDTLIPRVQLANGAFINAAPEIWNIENEDGEVLASYRQIPLTLAWAITVHKSQGMTLSAAEIDLSKTFEAGQGYVALSRVRALSGLKLIGMNDKSLLLDDFAITANRRFLELSADCELWHKNLSDEEKNKAIDTFLTKNAGLRAKPTSATPISDDEALKETLKLALEQKSLEEISSTLNLAKSTIIGHLNTLIKTKLLDRDSLDHLKSHSTIKAVEKMLETLESKGDSLEGYPKIRLLYEALDERILYNDIRLALLFLDRL